MLNIKLKCEGDVGLRAGQVEELLKEELYLTIYTREGDISLKGRLLTHLALPTDMTGKYVPINSSRNFNPHNKYPACDDTLYKI
jgi:hypothetical protein